MEPYAHILLATDLSEDADSAALRAVDLAQHYGARLTLLHVVDYSIDDLAIEWLEPPQTPALDFLRDRARQALTELASRLGRDQVDSAVIMMDVKSPVQEILQFAQERQVDLIVLGAHGHHGLDGWLNSASNSVLRRSPCDVLAIRVR